MQGSFFIPMETFLSGLFLKKNGPISASLNGPVKNNKQGGYVATFKNNAATQQCKCGILTYG